jgi:hypothetical protein
MGRSDVPHSDPAEAAFAAIGGVARTVKRLETQQIGFATKLGAASAEVNPVTTLFQDIPGCSVTFVVNSPSSLVLLWGAIDVEITAATTDYVRGAIRRADDAALVNGHTSLPGTGRTTLNLLEIVTGLAAGSHTWKLSVLKHVNNGTVIARTQASRLTALLIDR